MKPLLSIAIATKDREQYCIKTLQSILAYNDHRIEIAVADNSSTDAVRSFVKTEASDHIKYLYDSGPVSSIENFNRAVELTTGEYVMLIGDDDTILPKAIEIAEWAKLKHVDSVCSRKNVTYYWPGAWDKYPDGLLMVPQATAEVKQIDVKRELRTLLKHGLQNYLNYALPKTYHGLVRRKVMEEIKSRTGHFYGGLSPDLYSAVAVACTAKNHYQIDEPLSIAGICPTSTTADNLTGKHSGSLENIPHLRHRQGYVFDRRIPKFYSVNTIWAESGLKALEELNEVELLKEFNMFYLLVQAKIHNFKYISEIMEKETKILLRENSISSLEFKIKSMEAFIKIGINKLSSLKNNASRNTVVPGVLGIQQAVNFIHSK